MKVGRVVLRILLGLTLGLATTLAISWCLAAFVSIRKYPRTMQGAFLKWGRPWSIAGAHQPGITDLWWSDMQPDEPRTYAEVLVRSTQDRIADPANTRPGSSIRNSPPSWGTLARREPPERTIGSDSAFGWPVPCLWYQMLGSTVQSGAGSITLYHESLHGGVLLRGQPSARGRGTSFHALPLRPIPLGLAVDTLLFALAWSSLLFAPGVIRTRLRLRRGLCPACGYDPSGLPAGAGCPECGKGAA